MTLNSNENLLSVKEFAQMAQISKQAVYCQLDKRLKEYVVKVDNVKMIKAEAFEKFYSSQVDTSIQSSSSQVETEKEKSGEDNSSSEFDRVLEALTKQLEIKDKQIEDLNKRLEEMSSIVKQQQVLFDQQQKLMLVEKKDDIQKLAAATDTYKRKTLFNRRKK